MSYSSLKITITVLIQLFSYRSPPIVQSVQLDANQASSKQSQVS